MAKRCTPQIVIAAGAGEALTADLVRLVIG
jgi:hypothetical protein